MKSGGGGGGGMDTSGAQIRGGGAGHVAGAVGTADRARAGRGGSVEGRIVARSWTSEASVPRKASTASSAAGRTAQAARVASAAGAADVNDGRGGVLETRGGVGATATAFAIGGGCEAFSTEGIGAFALTPETGGRLVVPSGRAGDPSFIDVLLFDVGCRSTQLHERIQLEKIAA